VYDSAGAFGAIEQNSMLAKNTQSSVKIIYINISTFFDSQCVLNFQTHILNPTAANISGKILLEYFGTFCFFCHPLLASFWGRDSLKNPKQISVQTLLSFLKKSSTPLEWRLTSQGFIYYSPPSTTQTNTLVRPNV